MNFRVSPGAPLRRGFTEAVALWRAAVTELTWRRVLTAEVVGLVANVLRYLDGREQSLRQIFATAVFTILAPLLLVAAALCAAEAVRRGALAVRAYAVALAAAAGVNTALQFACRQVLGIHAVGVSRSVAVAQEWAWIGSDASNVILLGGIGLLAFYHRRSVERLLRGVRTTELRRIRLEHELVESRLATAQAQIDPRTLFESLARIRQLYGVSPAQAEQALQALIETLRSPRGGLPATAGTH